MDAKQNSECYPRRASLALTPTRSLILHSRFNYLGTSTTAVSGCAVKVTLGSCGHPETQPFNNHVKLPPITMNYMVMHLSKVIDYPSGLRMRIKTNSKAVQIVTALSLLEASRLEPCHRVIQRGDRTESVARWVGGQPRRPLRILRCVLQMQGGASTS